MPGAIFAHRRLAAVYDAFDGPRDDLAAYVEIAGELGADRVLDVGLIRLSGRIPAGRGHPINHHVAGAAPVPRGPR